MYIITCISLISIIVPIVIILTGIMQNSGETAAVGTVLFALVLLMHFAFGFGADWQHADTLENYILTPINPAAHNTP